MSAILRVLLPIFLLASPAFAAQPQSSRQIMDAVVAAWGEPTTSPIEGADLS